MSNLPDNVIAFIRKHIDSVEQLEMLLLLKRRADRDWTAAQVSRELSSHPDSATARLSEFCSKGLVIEKRSAESISYQYRPIPGLDSTLAQVAQAYGMYPVRLINLIFSKPIDRIRTFSDAFKFRKEDK